MPDDDHDLAHAQTGEDLELMRDQRLATGAVAGAAHGGAEWQKLYDEAYDTCMAYYAEAFTIKQTSSLSTLRYAACAYKYGSTQLAHQQIDKAFELSWGASKHIYDRYGVFRQFDETPFEVKVNWRYEYALNTTDMNRKLIARFDKIWKDMWGNRTKLIEAKKQYGPNSRQAQT